MFILFPDQAFATAWLFRDEQQASLMFGSNFKMTSTRWSCVVARTYYDVFIATNREDLFNQLQAEQALKKRKGYVTLIDKRKSGSEVTLGTFIFKDDKVLYHDYSIKPHS